MNVLVTGATGFVGRFVARLLSETDSVRVFARDEQSAHRVLPAGCAVFAGDFRDQASLRRAMDGVDVVYHIGARRDHWGLPYREYHESNIIGTRNVLDAARDAAVKKIVYCSTVGVYGFNFRYRPVDEAHPYGTHLSFYHKSKRLAEEIVLASDLPVVTVRPGWIYGPEDESGGVTQMLAKLAAGRLPFVGRGDNRIHPVYIDDVVDGILAAGRSEQYGQAFLLLGPQALTYREYVLSMCRALGVRAPRLQIPAVIGRTSCYVLEPAWLLKNRLLGKGLLGDKPPITRDTLDGVSTDRLYDVSKATALLGHTPRVTVDEGLARTVEWMASTGRLPDRVAARIAAKSATTA